MGHMTDCTWLRKITGAEKKVKYQSHIYLTRTYNRRGNQDGMSEVRIFFGNHVTHHWDISHHLYRENGALRQLI